jgi:hypothetical protein
MDVMLAARDGSGRLSPCFRSPSRPLVGLRDPSLRKATTARAGRLLTGLALACRARRGARGRLYLSGASLAPRGEAGGEREPVGRSGRCARD